MTYATTRIDPTRVEYTDPRNEELILAQGQPVLKELGIAVLGSRPLLTRPQRPRPHRAGARAPALWTRLTPRRRGVESYRA